MGKDNRARRKQKKAQLAARKSRQSKRASNRAKSQQFAPTFATQPNPFRDLSSDQRREVVEQLAASGQKQYQEALSYLKDLLQRYDPTLVLANVSSYGLSVPVRETTGVSKSESDLALFPFHAEILQALSLQTPRDDLSFQPFGPDVLAQVWENVKTLCEAQHLRHFNPDGIGLPPDQQAVALAQQLIRGATQNVRNWGHHSQIKRIARELYSPFDGPLSAARGLSASNVIDVFEAMVQQVEFRQTNRAKSLGDLFRNAGKSVRTLTDNYHELIGLGDDDGARFLEHIRGRGMPLETVRAMLLSHYDLRLPDLYTFHPSDFSAVLPIDEGHVSTILDHYALEWGSLSDYETDHLHLSNPVWTQPVIKLDHERYFCALPAGFFSFVIPCMESMLSRFGTAVSDRRAQYLESKVADIVRSRFPNSSTIENLAWTEDEKVYETDLIAFIDAFALIIECKSGRITPQALRGAPDRLRGRIRDLLIEPNVQSLRLKRRLELLGSNPHVADPLRDTVGHDLSRIRRVVRVSVCLEDFGKIQSSLKEFEDAGWLPEDFSPCPTMNLADLETVFDILEHPVQILHYLIRREAIEATVDYIADERDLLGLYLKTLFDLPEVEADFQLNLTGMAASLDHYYVSTDAGVDLPKPQPEISPLFRSIFAQLEQSAMPRWSEIGVALSMFSPDDQAKIAKILVPIEKRVRKGRKSPGHHNMLIRIPSKASSYALGYVMLNNETADQMRESMEHAAATAFQTNHVRSVVVIGRDVARPGSAYQAIALFDEAPTLAKNIEGH